MFYIRKFLTMNNLLGIIYIGVFIYLLALLLNNLQGTI